MNHTSGYSILLWDVGLRHLGLLGVQVWHLLPEGTGRGPFPVLGEGRAMCENQEVHLRTSFCWEEVNQRNQGIIHVKGQNAGKCYRGSLLSRFI